MYDDIDLSLIPSNAPAVAGYVNGKWTTFPDVLIRWPHAKHLSISVNAEGNAECLDVERFDATPDQAPNWVRRQLARGVKRPVIYCSVSDAREVLAVLKESGIKRSQIRLWTAHYNGARHLCSPACGFGMWTTADATQFTDKALGHSLDESLLSETFFVTQAELRAALRAWILARRARHWAWSLIKLTPQWKLWRRLGGR